MTFNPSVCAPTDVYLHQLTRHLHCALAGTQVGPFIKFGPLRNVEGVAEIVGSVNGAAVVLLLTACLSIYGATTFQSEESAVSEKGGGGQRRAGGVARLELQPRGGRLPAPASRAAVCRRRSTAANRQAGSAGPS